MNDHWTTEVAQKAKVLRGRSSDLSLIAGTHVMKGEN